MYQPSIKMRGPARANKAIASLLLTCLLALQPVFIPVAAIAESTTPSTDTTTAAAPSGSAPATSSTSDPKTSSPTTPSGSTTKQDSTTPATTQPATSPSTASADPPKDGGTTKAAETPKSAAAAGQETAPRGPVGTVGPASPTGPKGTVGPSQPTGDAASTYHYNEATGMWENDYYIWDPATKQTKPKQKQTYSYNPDTKMWDTYEWSYNAKSGQYEKNNYAVAVDPLVALGAGGGSAARVAGSTTGGSYDLFFDASITNRVSSSARSGDASLLSVTSGGSALSGQAEAIVNLVNLLQSAWGMDGRDIATFLANIDGNVVGDITIDPGRINSQLAVAPADPAVNLQVRSSGSGQINNQVDVAARSGDATISGTTSAGDAQSGNARAVINIINLINTIIAARQSFIGVININGNLNGDILLPQGFLEQLLAAANNQQATGGNLTATINSDQAISNRINATAASGSASADGNTRVGGTSSGNANNKLVLLNLTGRQFVARNSLLVFVNVLGTWVGLIMDAPIGTTAAAIGGGVTSSGLAGGTGNTSLEANSSSRINNDVNVSATSGNARLSNNTTAGSARSGEAATMVNLLNISGSQFALTDWFGVLFINVFGNWFGSFGINTAAGNPPAGPVSAGLAAPGGTSGSGGVFGFATGAAQQAGVTTAGRVSSGAGLPVGGGTTGSADSGGTFVAGTSVTLPPQPAPTTPVVNATARPARHLYWLILGVSLALSALMLAWDVMVAAVRSRVREQGTKFLAAPMAIVRPGRFVNKT